MSKTTKLAIMDRTGDTRLTVVNDPAHKQELLNNGVDITTLISKKDATDRIVEEMAGGKWVRIVDNEGSSDTVTTVEDFEKWNKDNDIIDDTQELMMLAALVGG